MPITIQVLHHPPWTLQIPTLFLINILHSYFQILVNVRHHLLLAWSNTNSQHPKKILLYCIAITKYILLIWIFHLKVKALLHDFIEELDEYPQEVFLLNDTNQCQSNTLHLNTLHMYQLPHQNNRSLNLKLLLNVLIEEKEVNQTSLVLIISNSYYIISTKNVINSISNNIKSLTQLYYPLHPPKIIIRFPIWVKVCPRRVSGYSFIVF